MARGLQGIICKQCNQPAPRTGQRQFYCVKCSDERHKATQRRHYEKRGHTYDPEKHKLRRERIQARWRHRGIAVSKEVATDIASAARPPDIAWMVRVAVPFSRHGSKNAKFGSLYRSHVYVKKDHRAWQARLEAVVRKAMRGRVVKQNKVWIDIFVQKESHKSDAVNFIDTVCDAVKKAIDLDDRWFCIRSVDWEIVKHEPKIYVGICQEEVEDVQACSYCGQLLALTKFSKRSAAPRGVGRICGQCIGTASRLRKEGRMARLNLQKSSAPN